MEKTGRLFGLVVLGVFVWFLSSTGEAATISVNCGNGGTGIQTAITGATSGDIISVTGTCNENVDITKSGLTIDGNTSAIIHGPSSTIAAIRVRASSTTIKNFASIEGNQDGIYVVWQGPTILNNTIQNTVRYGILVAGGSGPVINGNIIQNAGSHGISAYANSFVYIINNQISNNAQHGIIILESSSARIGIMSSADAAASPNTITGNGGNGVSVEHSSNARIVGNTISDNAGDGVMVYKLCHADIASNTIDNNQHGITVVFNSVVNLSGNGSGVTIFDSINTTTVNNFYEGVNCNYNSYVGGNLGTLNGNSGPIRFGYEGVGTKNPIYQMDVSGGNVSRSQLHFSKAGTDTGGWVTSVLDNNFWVSSGAMYDQVAGGWIQKSSDGKSVMAGSGGVGYRVFTSSGNTVGSPIATQNLVSRLHIDYSGNVGLGIAPAYPLHLAGGAYSNGANWYNASSREYKDNIRDLSTEEALVAFQELNPVTFTYKAGRGEQHVGFIAEDVPGLVATNDRKGLSSMDIVAVLTKVVQEQRKEIEEQKKEYQKTISVLSERMDELEKALQLKRTLIDVK